MKNKPVRELNELAARYGFGPATPTRGGHLAFRHSSGAVVHTGSSPSDFNARKALEAEFKKVNEGRLPTDPGQLRRRGIRGLGTCGA